MGKPKASSTTPSQSGRSTPSTVSLATTPTWTSSATPSYTTPILGDSSSTRLYGPGPGPGPGQAVNSKRSKNNLEHARAASIKTTQAYATKHRRAGSMASNSVSTVGLSDSNDLKSATALQDEYYLGLASDPKRNKVKIKSLAHKFAPADKNSLDLSRSVAENEGLGIYTSSDRAREYAYSGGHSRIGFHNRSTSEASQASVQTSPSVHQIQYQAQAGAYVHPMRQHPRPYTPPIARNHSYDSSVVAVDSEPAQQAALAPAAEQLDSSYYHTQPVPYAPLPGTSSNRSTLSNARTSSYNNKPVASPSLTSINTSVNNNIPGTPSSLRYTDNYSSPVDAMPSTTRSSLESHFRSFRTRSRSNTNNVSHDPEVQAATVKALREKFAAAEAAKEAKYEAREERKRQKQEDAARRKSEHSDRKQRARSRSDNTTSNTSDLQEKYAYTGVSGYDDPRSKAAGISALTAVEYSSTQPQQFDDQLANARREVREKRSLQNMKGSGGNTIGPGPNGTKRTNTGLSTSKSAARVKAGKAGKGAKSQWSLFWFRFQTLWLKLKKSMGVEIH